VSDLRILFGMQKYVSVPKPERGVYWAMATKKGRPMVFAVDSAGDEVLRLILKDDTWARAEAAIEQLWRHLDMVDPRPQLCVARPVNLPSTAPRVRRESAAAEYDPYNDPRPVSLRLVRPW
jgi:hypothetical protein